MRSRSGLLTGDVNEETREQEQLRFQAHALDQINDAVIGTDLDGRIIYWNQAVERLSGFAAEETLGRLVGEITPVGSLESEDLDDITALLAERGRWRGALTVTVRNGRKMIVDASHVLLRGYSGEPVGGLAVVRDVTARTRAEEGLRKREKQLATMVARLRESQEGVVRALGSVTEYRDPYTAGHQHRVSELACALGKRMGLPGKQEEAVKVAGLVHDIGKFAVPVEILVYPGPLGSAQRALINVHPTAGYEILKSVRFSWPVAQIVREHHERLDGSGYPQGLVGEHIMLEARVLGVADTVEAMTANRPYRLALGIAAALAEIEAGQNRLYDPRVVQACLAVVAAGDWTPGSTEPTHSALRALQA